VKCYIWSIVFSGAETWTLRKVDQKYLDSFKTWCWRRMEKINWIGHILCRNSLLKHISEEKIEGGI
jgi:hypothetical protein